MRRGSNLERFKQPPANVRKGSCDLKTSLENFSGLTKKSSRKHQGSNDKAFFS